MRLSLSYSAAIPIYFSLILFMAIVAGFLGGGFGLTAYLNVGTALIIFTLLAFSFISSLLNTPGWKPKVTREALPLVLILMFMIVSGVGLALAGGNSKIYIISTTLYWTNMILFILYVSSYDCTQVDILKFIKWVAIISCVSPFIGLSTDIAIRNLLACGFVVFAFGERRYLQAAFCILPFVIGFSSMSRSGLLAVLICVMIGALIYRRSLLFSVLILGLLGIISIFPFLDLANLIDPSSNMYRRLNEIQIIMSGETRLDEIVALQQRLFEIRLVNYEMDNAGPLGQLLGLGFGKTLDMSATQDTSVMAASTIGLSHVHNVHSLPHSIFLRSGSVGLLYLAVVIAMASANVLRTMFLRHVPPLLAICVLFPWTIIMSALPASNYFLTEFSLPAMLILSAILIRRQRQYEGWKGAVIQTNRKRIIWSG